MTSRQKDRDAPGPREPWNRIVPHLWVGGHYFTPPGGEREPAVVDDEFDLVVSLFTLPGHGPAPGVEHIVREVPDDYLTAPQLRAVQEAATLTAHAVRQGRRTLVRCHSGYNRSGLVAAQALVELGHEAGRAIALVREHRSPRALANVAFVDYLTTGLDTAYLLAGLDTGTDG
ncbi:protein phosphatase [Kitasatospora sp. NPDC097605]|uniref:protein-tyrosine phosphatase family protein n=1 Tax=Kitasatospora sp. NPDC097605 TaxID=3157226 RepID=UPI00331CAE69